MQPTSNSGKRTSLPPLFWVLLTAALLRFSWVIYSPALPVSDFEEYRQLGLSVAQGEGFSYQGTPSTYRPPGYPLFLAGIFSLSGGSLRAVQLVQIALGVLAVFLTHQIGLRTFDRRVALLAAWIVACFPSLIAYTSLLASENLAISLFLLSILAFLRYLQGRRLRWAFTAGLLCGLTGLVRPEVLPLVFLWAIYDGFMRRSISSAVTTGLVLLLGLSAALLPWTLRNGLLFDRWTPVSSNGGIMLLASFNPQSADPEANAEVFAPLYKQAGQFGWDEFEVSQAAARQALGYLKKNPLVALQLAPIKLFHLLGDDVSGVSWNLRNAPRSVPRNISLGLTALAQVYYMAVVLLALAATAFHKSLRRYPLAGILLIPIIYWLVFFAIFIATDRYHLPILPLLALFSAFSLTRLKESKPRIKTRA